MGELVLTNCQIEKEMVKINSPKLPNYPHTKISAFKVLHIQKFDIQVHFLTFIHVRKRSLKTFRYFFSNSRRGTNPGASPALTALEWFSLLCRKPNSNARRKRTWYNGSTAVTTTIQNSSKKWKNCRFTNNEGYIIGKYVAIHEPITAVKIFKKSYPHLEFG